ncbi:MAG TPA: hypothetical protein VIL30_18085 [Ramlibacter sp.]|jgi:hypothetical protein
MQIIYSTEKVENAGGRKVKNPRHFLAPIEGATKVFIAGDWPRIAAAYKVAGVAVGTLDDMRAPVKSAATKKPSAIKAADRKPKDQPATGAEPNPPPQATSTP